MNIFDEYLFFLLNRYHKYNFLLIIKYSIYRQGESPFTYFIYLSIKNWFTTTNYNINVIRNIFNYYRVLTF